MTTSSLQKIIFNSILYVITQKYFFLLCHSTAFNNFFVVREIKKRFAKIQNTYLVNDSGLKSHNEDERKNVTQIF